MEPNKTLKAVIDTKYIDTRTQESLKQGIMELLNLSLEEMVKIFMSIDAPTGKEPLEWIRDFLSDYVGEETLEYGVLHMDSRDKLSVIIRKKREEKGLTQEELSQIIHKSDKYIGAVECGRITPPYVVLTQIVRILEIDGNTLFYEDTNEEVSKMADIYLRKMDSVTQKLALQLLQTMANFRNPKENKKKLNSGSVQSAYTEWTPFLYLHNTSQCAIILVHK